MSGDRISFNARLHLWRGLMIFSMLILLVAIFRLQVLQSDQYVSLAAKNRLRLVRMPPARGRILDSNGTVLATNVQTFDLMVYPLDVQKPETAEEIRSFLNSKGIPLTGEDILARVRRDYTVPYRAVDLIQNLTLTQLASLAGDPEFPRQLFPVPVWKRGYPAGPLVAHVLGYVGEITREELERFSGDYRGRDFVGKSGVEEYYEEILKGSPGEEALEVDARGRKVQRIG
jgi:penicillin-binding protein 2